MSVDLCENVKSGNHDDYDTGDVNMLTSCELSLYCT